MEIPISTLDQIKCSKCDNVLSKAPVYRQADGTALCSSCYQPQHGAFRDTYYEALAKHFRYPCRNLIHGCNHLVPFSNENQLTAHEKKCCLHKCPLGVSTLCKWKGIITKMDEHCKNQHEDVILFNPFTFFYNISKGNCETIIIRAFQKLFSTKIYFEKNSPTLFLKTVLLGKMEKKDTFQLELVVKLEKQILMKEEKITIPEFESESCPVKLNTGDTNKSISITIKIHIADESTLDFCPKCGTLVRDMYYRDYDGWWCKDCAPNKETCNLNNCLYLDFPFKLSKHIKYFCAFLNQCSICETELTANIFDHYTSAHGLETSTWRASEYNVEKWCLISGEAGPALCRYELYEMGFELVILYPIKSEQLKEFGCEVQVTLPETKESKTFTLPALYDDESDWYIDIKKQNFVSWSQHLDIYVKIYKI